MCVCLWHSLLGRHYGVFVGLLLYGEFFILARHSRCVQLNFLPLWYPSIAPSMAGQLSSQSQPSG